MPVLIGVVACLLITGSAMLAPGNVNWLTHGDLAQSYLGWAFYRHAPWGWPPGANSLYGAGLHTSVYYSDSIPLLAMLLKPWASWLPEPFQYFGLWVLACFVLQAWFAWRLLGLATQNPVVKALGVPFFVFAPPMLLRLGGHMALVGHWIVLAAVYLCLRPDRRRQALYWGLLLAVAITVHAYLFAMAGAIWLADVVQRFRVSGPDAANARIKTLLSELLSVVAVAVFAAWIAGLFMVSGHGAQAEGFGYYKMNVLAPFNGAGWSHLGLNFPEATGEYEGFNYFGLGGLVLILSAAVITMARRRALRTRRIPGPLLWMALLLAIAAVTCNVGIGSLQWHMPLPEKWWAALSRVPLQSTGRLFWASYYVVLVASLFVLLQSCSVRWQIAVLFGAIVLQCLDIAPGFANLHATLAARARNDSVPGLHGAFWDTAGQRYTTLRVVPLAKPSGWEQLAFYANSQRMGFDAVQLARIDMDKFHVLYNDQQTALLSGNLDTRTLYLLDDRELAVARAIPASRAALFQLDGKNVLAPAWTAPLPSSAIDLRATASTSPFNLPFQSDFTQTSHGRLLVAEGWDATGEGVMSLDDRATLFVPDGSDTQRPLNVQINLHRANTGKSMAMELEAWSDGKRVGSCHMANDGCRTWVFEVPGVTGEGYFRKLELRPGTPTAKLRIALDAISVQ
ncbi:DUF6311 domain-containing protein [Dyella acidisoli]|uniref:YfhO family protein n=1 Tax=Dyella acidisoli TaxID=1867834 RepID=A0ABQ5XWH8_9GAMM|nr:DUF6311 domain-containing protein [Dyella acidisoli]GLQ94723.1 hypothetical protein GCM10007901_36750 [Dyella acidisoli]